MGISPGRGLMPWAETVNFPMGLGRRILHFIRLLEGYPRNVTHT